MYDDTFQARDVKKTISGIVTPADAEVYMLGASWNFLYFCRREQRVYPKMDSNLSLILRQASARLDVNPVLSNVSTQIVVVHAKSSVKQVGYVLSLRVCRQKWYNQCSSISLRTETETVAELARVLSLVERYVNETYGCVEGSDLEPVGEMPLVNLNTKWQVACLFGDNG